MAIAGRPFFYAYGFLTRPEDKAIAIEHRNIPEDGLHEPKGVSEAASDRVYISDGAGSGAWSLVDADAMQGTISNSLAAGRRLETDGSGGIRTGLVPAFSFGTMNLSDNATIKAITAATDTTLNTNSDFQEIDLAFTFESTQNITTGSNFLQIDETGVYLIDFWANIAVDVGNTRWALKFVINGTDFVARSPKLFIASSGEFYNTSANGLHEFTAGDQIKLYMASNKNVDVTIEDLTFQIVLIGE